MYLFLFFLNLMMRICALIEIELSFLCHDLKVLEVINNLRSIIHGIIVKSFVEYILVLLREGGDDQPLILKTKLILKETLMIEHVQHQVKQFGLPDATEQLSLFRLWFCENFIFQVSQREIKNSSIF